MVPVLEGGMEGEVTKDGREVDGETEMSYAKKKDSVHEKKKVERALGLLVQEVERAHYTSHKLLWAAVALVGTLKTVHYSGVLAGWKLFGRSWGHLSTIGTQRKISDSDQSSRV